MNQKNNKKILAVDPSGFIGVYLVESPLKKYF